MVRVDKPFPKNFKIYRIDNGVEPEKFYVGSTRGRLLKQRIKKHKYDARKRPEKSRLFTFMHEKAWKNSELL